MVTSFTRKDLIDFARFVNDWSKNGMLQVENGVEQISEGLVNNWLVSKQIITHRNNCPNAEFIAQMFMHNAPHTCLFKSYDGLTESDHILKEAKQRGVAVIYPSIQSGKIENWDVNIQGDRKKEDLIFDFVKCSKNSNGVPCLITHIPGVVFPIYKNRDIICFGLCCHNDDIKPLPMSKN